MCGLVWFDVSTNPVWHFAPRFVSIHILITLCHTKQNTKKQYGFGVFQYHVFAALLQNAKFHNLNAAKTYTNKHARKLEKLSKI